MLRSLMEELKYSRRAEQARIAHRPSLQNGLSQRDGDVDWEFGRQVSPRRVFKRNQSEETPYHLNLVEHSGVVMGQTEEGITMSLLRLGSLAARHGWKVVLFDPQTNEDRIAEFDATMLAAGCERVYHFSDQTRRYDLNRTAPAPSGTLRTFELLRQADKVEVPPPLPFTFQWYLDNVLTFDEDAALMLSDGSDPETVGASAAYIGVNVWSQPVQAREFARALLKNLLTYLSEQIPDETCQTLLLIKHPELLFEEEHMLPLFSLMEQAHGSAFVAVRSPADFRYHDMGILKNARTVIAHRGDPTWDILSCLSNSKFRRNAFFEKTVRALPDDECFVIHGGQATHVRVSSVNPELPTVVSGNSRPPTGDGFSTAPHAPRVDVAIDDDDIDDVFASLFGPGDLEEEQEVSVRRFDVQATTCPWHSLHRAVKILSPDQVHLRNALLLLCLEDR